MLAVWPLLLAHVGPLPLAPTSGIVDTDAAFDAASVVSSNSPLPPPASSPFFVPRDRLAVALHVDLRAGELVALSGQPTPSGGGSDSAGSGDTSEQYAPLLDTLSHLQAAVGEFVLQPAGELSTALLGGDEQATQLSKVRPAATRTHMPATNPSKLHARYLAHR